MRKTALASTLNHQAPNDVVRDHHLHLLLADELHQLLVVDVAKLCHNVPLDLQAAAQGEHDPHCLGIRLVGVTVVGHDSHRTGMLGRHLLQVRNEHGVAAAADHHCSLQLLGREEADDLLLHLMLLALRHHDDDAAALTKVGLSELANQRQDLVIPSEDQGVVLLQHFAEALLQRVHAVGQGIRHETDEQRVHEHASHGQEETNDDGQQSLFVQMGTVVEEEGPAPLEGSREAGSLAAVEENPR
mmetsp:Transcript_9866/g.40009  ORF Transcript_9866/g.40009 Transcript_9866/m.40009 type:complete len:244 (+) Transcript_9866:1079-1810(+)